MNDERREFITLLGGAAAAWPIAARAQQAGKLPTIGVLGGATHSAESQRVAAFVQRLARTWLDRGSYRRDRVSLGGGPQCSIGEIAAEFVRLKVDVILATGTAPAFAAKQATSVIPIVFAFAGDPVGTGLVASLARPGGNVTGMSNQATDLRLSGLNCCARSSLVSAGLAIMANAGYPAAVLEMGEVQAAASTLGVEVSLSTSGKARTSHPLSKR